MKLKKRTPEEMKAYVEGYNACDKLFRKYLKKEKTVEDAVKAAWNIFGPSYEYRKRYNEYKAKKFAEMNQYPGQMTIDDWFKENNIAAFSNS